MTYTIRFSSDDSRYNRLIIPALWYTHCFSSYFRLKALHSCIELKTWHSLVVVLASLTENKDGVPTSPCDQSRAGSSQDKVSVTGELQHQLPAPPQTSDFRGDHWALARPRPTPLEVCFVSLCVLVHLFCPDDIEMSVLSPVMSPFVIISMLNSFSQTLYRRSDRKW